ncbi:MAG: hypothetical protein WCY97_08340 [Methanothrix sp.]|uniref:Uncharacterized protein n=1 Tax=Methanothrix harundinacea TaxID=301375 RepID=A0A117LFI9_9EURY|nr:MAG: hypothetical protein XD72_1221 [Methanothrix harundinacea]MCP1392090.1 hypothetical protein [Methanothrix harundinacea]MDD3566363.1 hypothetical protein [Methanothrix sp.]MDD5515676.1 hypothetical protein [Synergistales bacterium]MDI9398784.1 hypothetical protein [Euryarchaeota archaeon]
MRYLRWNPGYPVDPAPWFYRRLREMYPELAYESKRDYTSNMLADDPIPLVKLLSQEQMKELAAMEMDLQVEIAEKELALANKAREMMRKSMRTK